MERKKKEEEKEMNGIEIGKIIKKECKSEGGRGKIESKKIEECGIERKVGEDKGKEVEIWNDERKVVGKGKKKEIIEKIR